MRDHSLWETCFEYEYNTNAGVETKGKVLSPQAEEGKVLELNNLQLYLIDP